MKKNYIIPATRVIDCESDELMLITSPIGKGDPFDDGEYGTADSKYRDFDDYEDSDEDLW